jgi:hypothetical protein
MKLREYREALERCIRHVTRQFVANEGQGAFNFCNEAEIEAALFCQLRPLPLMKAHDKDGYYRPLVHLHWPCVKKRFIDIVIWYPREINLYRKGWGHSPSQTAPRRRVLAAIQIKLGGGRMPAVRNVKKDLTDLERIGRKGQPRQAQLYFIGFVDHNLRKSRSKDRYHALKKIMEDWCDEDPKRRKVLLLSKDRVGFVYPRERWVIDVLPAGVTESP